MLFLNKQFKRLCPVIFRCVQKKNSIYSISYDDSRLQMYLRSLKDQYSNSRAGEKILYSNEALRNIISHVQDIELLNAESTELTEFILELKEKKDEMVANALIEKEDLENRINDLKTAVLHLLIPDEIMDQKDIILELTPGVGGQEAMLFTKDIFEMYCNFVQYKGWSYDILKYDDTGIGGLRSGHISISGHNAFKTLKYESGVHRVQRVPKTEKSGRIHTSTMTVAILPQPNEIDIKIDPKDIEIEFKRSGGAGGQHVNTTDSCARIYHKPTGLIVESQVERIQHRNKELAMKSLRAKLYDRELEKSIKETTLNRKLQIGTAGRSEKIRTYNIVQDRITDHRAHVTFHGVESFFNGGQLLDNLIHQLQEWNSINSLEQLLEKYDACTRIKKKIIKS